MSISIRPVRLNHMNVVVEDFDASLAHFQQCFGAELLVDLPSPVWHAALIDIGGVIIEPFVPPSFLLNARYGPHYLGVEYQADMEEVRAALETREIRVARDIGAALHTHPADTLGVAFEFFADEFHRRNWPLLGRRMRPAGYWRDEHALGLTGLKAYTLAVHDIDTAAGFLQSLLDAKPVYEQHQPGISAHALGLQVADAAIELLAPDGPGELMDHLHRYGQGIRSMVFGVRDMAQASQYFSARGLPLRCGDGASRFAIPAEHNLGLIFEFSE